MHTPLKQKQTYASWQSRYLLLTWLHMLWISSSYPGNPVPAMQDFLSLFFHICTWLSYSFIYLLPLILIIQGLRRLPDKSAHWQTLLIVLISVVLLVLVRVDHMIYALYKFHINRFVLNLLFTPGGISSLGSEGASQLSLFLMLGTLTALQFAFLFVSRSLQLSSFGRVAYLRYSSALLVFCFVTQGLIYGVSDITHYSPVLEGSRAWPLFQRIRFHSLANTLGFERAKDSWLKLETADTPLVYPLQPVKFNNGTRPPNIIMLVAESLRWDQLSADIMPNTLRFGAEHLQFEQHYSSGNGTREGLFGMFYGLYGSYWEQFMHMRQSPLLMDRLQALHYQFDLRTGATFTYPEFDKTLFAHFDKASLIEADDALPPWQRDRNNMDALLDFIAGRKADQPFMSFMFMESTHASYSFPPEQALYQDYQQDVDYTKLSGQDLANNIEPLFRRYHNAAHWLDLQLGRLYATLEAEGLLESTVVIVTGDHGEEFMEKGAWGHNSAFVEEQTHVPLVMHIPGQAARHIRRTSSHLDIATTLLQLLGAPANSESYSLGQSLLALQDRKYIVISDWHSIGVQTADMKYRIPYLNSGVDYWQPTDHSDAMLPENMADTLVARYQSLLLEAMALCSRFTRQG